MYNISDGEKVKYEITKEQTIRTSTNIQDEGAHVDFMADQLLANYKTYTGIIYSKH